MLIENEFEVPAPVDRTWDYLLDVEKVAPCAPGAELTEVVDERTWKGRMLMKLGPVSLSFSGTVTMEERHDDDHRVVLVAKGQETKGKGAASATVTSWLEDLGAETRVKMQADITLSGTVAQLSRGLLPDVSAKLTHRFAECLRESISAEGAPAGARVGGPAAVAPAATPHPALTTPPLPGQPSGPPGPRPRAQAIGGIRLGLWAVWRAVVRFFRRLVGGGR
ncbi:MAG: SRPBCC family protein [Candidatus Velamenicoccus archaeovorus]